MTITKTKLDGLCVIEPKILGDERGAFIKTYNEDVFAQAGISFAMKESYYSISKKDVIRGMHFQSPPQAHAKLVYVTRGAILDVVLDIRRGSATYGQYVTVEITEENRKIMSIPVGFAHGFLARTDGACVVYLQTTCYSPENDRGIRSDSFGFDWGVAQPIMSARDKSFPMFAEFETPL